MAVDGREGELLSLSDGRALAYAEWGAPDGRPVVFLQGIPGGRLNRWWDDELPSDRGIRLITVDRPGIGRSDFKRGRSVGDWPADAEQLADHLRLERFPLIGFSAGGPYALAAAARLQDRVSAVGLVSALGRTDMTGVVDEMATARYFKLAGRSPAVMGLIYAAVARQARKDPDAAHKRFFARSSRIDRAVLDRPEVKARWMPAFIDAAQGRGRGLGEDMRVVQRPWGFDPADVRLPVHLWHGDADRIVPRNHAEHWTQALPDCQPHWCPGEGHFLIQDHGEEILDTVAPEGQTASR